MSGFRFASPPGALFESGVWVATTTPLAPRQAELDLVGHVYVLEPEDEPLRAARVVSRTLPPSAAMVPEFNTSAGAGAPLASFGVSETGAPTA